MTDIIEVTETAKKRSFRTCDGECCEEAKDYLFYYAGDWKFIVERAYPAQVGPLVEYCPWCGWKLKSG